MEKEFVTYKQARALKELGFDESTYNWRQHGNGISGNVEGKRDYYNRKGDVYVALPRYSQVFRWFREKHKITGLVQRDISRNYNGWWFKIFSQIEEKDNPITLYSENFNKNTYEEAESACLDKLIEITKNKTND